MMVFCIPSIWHIQVLLNMPMCHQAALLSSHSRTSQHPHELDTSCPSLFHCIVVQHTISIILHLVRVFTIFHMNLKQVLQVYKFHVKYACAVQIFKITPKYLGLTQNTCFTRSAAICPLSSRVSFIIIRPLQS